jgi:transposase
MATVFCDRKGVLMVEFMQQGTTVKSQVYFETPPQKILRRAGHSEQKAWNVDIGAMLLHDNSRPHTASCVLALLEHFNWELFDHPPYSPDLAPSDYHLFTCLKDRLVSQRFNNNDELMEGVKTWQSSQAADFSDIGIQKLIPRYDKWLNSSCDYIEK